jgi:hypothetical protein
MCLVLAESAQELRAWRGRPWRRDLVPPRYIAGVGGVGVGGGEEVVGPRAGAEARESREAPQPGQGAGHCCCRRRCEGWREGGERERVNVDDGCGSTSSFVCRLSLSLCPAAGR